MGNPFQQDYFGIDVAEGDEVGIFGIADHAALEEGVEFIVPGMGAAEQDHFLEFGFQDIEQGEGFGLPGFVHGFLPGGMGFVQQSFFAVNTNQLYLVIQFLGGIVPAVVFDQGLADQLLEVVFLEGEVFFGQGGMDFFQQGGFIKFPLPGYGIKEFFIEGRTGLVWQEVSGKEKFFAAGKRMNELPEKVGRGFQG